MKTFLKIVRVIADLVIVVGVITFVDSVIGYTSSDEASMSAGLIVFSFVVKGWISQYSRKSSEKAEDADSSEEISSPGTVMSVVGVILIASVAFGAMDKADDALDEAQDAMSRVEDLEYRVDDLEY